MKKFPPLSLISLAVISTFTHAHAEDTQNLDEIQVTAEQQVKQSLGVSVITEKDLELNPIENDASEIIAKQPGVTLSTNAPGGARGNKRQVDIRAMGPENTLILVDGKPVKSRNSERYGRNGTRNTRGDTNWVPADAIESIEVLRGPAAARYGSGAMGGVVNIKTKAPTTEYHGSLNLFTEQPEDRKEGYTNRLGFNFSGPLIKDILGFRLYGNIAKTQADALDINSAEDAGTNNNAATQDNTRYAGREGVRNRDVAAQLVWNITPDQKLTFDATYSRQGNIYNGDTQNSSVLVSQAMQTSRQLALQKAETSTLYRQSYSLTHEGKWGAFDNRTYFTFDQTRNYHYPEGLLGSMEGAYNGLNKSVGLLRNYRFSNELYIPFTLGSTSHMVTVGAEASRSELNDAASMTQTMQVYAIVPWLADQGRSGKVAQNEWAAFLEDNIMLPNNKTILTPGIRFDSSTNSKSNWSPSFNFSHQVNENWKIKGGVARAYKAPNLYQSSPNYLLINASNGCPIDSANNWNNPNALNPTGGDGTRNNPYTNSNTKGFDWGRACYFLGNENIKPETSWNKEIGFEYENEGKLFSLAYFHNDYRNKIVSNGEFLTTIDAPNGGYNREIRRENVPGGVPIWRNYTATNVYRWGNTPRAIIEGIEGNITLPFFDGNLTLGTNFTYMIKNENKKTGNAISLVPKYTINTTLNWRINEQWDLNTTYTRYGKQKTVVNPENFMQVIYNTGESIVKQYQMGSYGIWGANVGYKFNDNFSLRVGVNNILDKRIYRNATTARIYNERGRSYFANLKYSF
ncbi:FepA family TonB-dependent siderophore receptor [Aggregatibacter actinomycetemcomitans]|uniref:FepA family TonB-dependent siderophore receptor n=1 Tax=Aggregatibacter actinomycetemcomitans TaxID=714 RepID=UPI00197BC22B|nr:FepA family TonB-dependent siderophore receptor [Aggregatibacter actinomycetemcomitans]MBN6079444.1 FepA family TonB-dependent siderophore receptor [Aggregatibacter actinomycetemcomitans]